MTREELLAVSKPILFNTDMVRAILEGRKRVTRRVIKPRYRDDEYGFRVVTCKVTGAQYLEKTDEDELGFDSPRYIKPPYQVGDHLYVRETWRVQAAKRYEALIKIGYRAGVGVTTIHFPNGCTDSINRVAYDTFVDKWRLDRWYPSIHMSKEAARIFLRVTEVRVARLQDMNGREVLKEGVNSRVHPNASYFDGNQREMFAELWDSTIPKKELDKYGWVANPWVWVIQFERVDV